MFWSADRSRSRFEQTNWVRSVKGIKRSEHCGVKRRRSLVGRSLIRFAQREWSQCQPVVSKERNKQSWLCDARSSTVWGKGVTAADTRLMSERYSKQRRREEEPAFWEAAMDRQIHSSMRYIILLTGPLLRSTLPLLPEDRDRKSVV